MAIDTEAIKVHVRGILEALGDDPDREGLKETPDRVARMYEEVFEGMNYTNHEIAQMFNKTFTDRMEFGSASRDMVIVIFDTPYIRILRSARKAGFNNTKTFR